MTETGTTRQRERIDRTVAYYFAGLRDGSVGSLKEAFHPKALVSGYIGTEKFVKPVQFLYQYVRKNPSPAKQGERFTCRIVGRAIAGRTAVVTLRERNYLAYDYVTVLQMMEVKQRWWIVSKLFSGTPSA
jgi:hypothetical protein